jgi:hypothetical protein
MFQINAASQAIGIHTRRHPCGVMPIAWFTLLLMAAVHAPVPIRQTVSQPTGNDLVATDRRLFPRG